MKSKIQYHKNILIIDDNYIDLLIAEKVIRYSGFENTISISSSISSALILIENALVQNKNIPSLIFLDIVLPHLDAFDFIEKFNKIFRLNNDKPQIIILTAALNPEQKEKLIKLHSITAYIDKPLTVEHMTHFLKQNPFSHSIDIIQ